MTNGKVVQKVRVKPLGHSSHSTPIVFVGAGNLGGAVIKALVAKRVYAKSKILVITASQASAARWRRWGVRAVAGDYSALASAREVWLAVKPAQIRELAPSLKIKSGARVISLLAGWTPSALAKVLKQNSVVITVMTNTAARANAGLYAVFYAKALAPSFRAELSRLFAKLGHFCGFYGEAQMPEVTALVGSAPAFLLHLQREYESFAAQSGVTPKVARAWWAALGRANEALVTEQPDLAQLMREIATPGGCTERGLSALDKFTALERALGDCAVRAKEMGT
ncbi:MAG TPA: pyrroline-5-carboxylate reductase dimerization domain-containing protein [Bdellovibrionota bacterium]|jgi:pyrroline-5-carboxylate reductase|nr:pyrroline-5-carboxylate reductase dimerization domain-containing protein [Bdellovibrionota bacterium]